MNVLILTTSNPYKAAGVVALDIKMALSQSGDHKVKILTRSYDNYPDKSIISLHSRAEEYVRKILNLSRIIVNKLMRAFFGYKPTSKTDPNYAVQGLDLTKDYYPTKLFLKRIGDFKPDAIIVLFMPYFLTFKNLYELNKATNAPILLYMMDMAPMTGGCHYAWDCMGYQKNCGNCPALFSTKEDDQSRKNLEFKQKYISKTDLKVIAATEHQHRQLLESSLFREKEKLKILLSIDHQLFKPADPAKARIGLNLPTDKRIIFFGATNVMSKRKGYNELVESLKIFSTIVENPQEIHLAIAGGGGVGLINELPFSHTLLGRLNHTDLAAAFQAADLFLCPSIEDSGPMMINQSVMSGTPVVAFEMGVALDLVVTGETGYRAKLKDTADLASGILQIILQNEHDFSKMKKNCRNVGMNLLSPQKQGKNFFNSLKHK